MSSGTDFGDLVAQEIPGLYRHAVSMLTDRDRAEDLVGETVLRALEHAAQYRGEASLRTWLHRILYHLAIDRARQGAHEVSVESVEAWWHEENYGLDPSVVLERAQTAEDMREALVHLPDGYRSVLVLHDAEGWPVGEIAEMLEISLPAAKQRLRRARIMLVSALAREGERRAANQGVPLSCREARDRVSAYLDDELPADERSSLEAHLGHCATCPPLYQTLVGVTASLGTLHDPDSVIPAGVAERIRARTGLR